MRTSEIVQVVRDVEQAMKDAGRGEFHGMKLLVRLDEMGYDLQKRPLSPHAVVAAVEACATIAGTVESSRHPIAETDPEIDRLFSH